MHTLKSILLHLDSSERCIERVRVARQLAETFGAEVKGLYAVTPLLWRYAASMAESAMVADELIEQDRENGGRSESSFKAAAAGSPLMSWAELTDDTPWSFLHRAMYCDLMVLGQRNPDDMTSAETPPDFLSSMLLDSGRPALVLPYTGAIAPIGRTVLVAWKETREAARAVAAALPWLCRAEHVHLICYADDPDENLKALQGYLLTHGVATTLHHGVRDQGRTGELLLSEAADLSADLLVMGCYGHSRARERVFGGASRTILETMTLPVLMAH